jgi:hypothetical protein
VTLVATRTLIVVFAIGANTGERDYIRSEARSMVEKNSEKVAREGNSPEAVQGAIIEGEERLAWAIHNDDPYPRLSYVPPGQSGTGDQPPVTVPK